MNARILCGHRSVVLDLMMLPLLLGAGQISVNNHQEKEVLRYPCPLLRGTVEHLSAPSITIINTSSKYPTRQMEFPVHKGRFKALAELVPGENRLVLRCEGAQLELTLTYKPQTNPYIVRCIYMTDSTGDATYQSQLPDDPQNYAAKLDAAMKLMQTFTAERMADLGYGHITFNLELDQNDQVKVHVYRGKLKAEEYYAMNDQDWWRQVARELEEPYPTRQAKNFVVAAYSRFDPVTKKTRGHTALGGGGLGLFGSGNLFTWPSGLADVPRAFTDGTRIDNTRVQDDSAGRGMFWGAAATTMGAGLHETSHTFGLPHTREPQDIMTRGFDHFNRVFTFTEPSLKPGQPAREFTEDHVACFPPISAAALVPCRWFALDEREYAPGNRVTAKIDQKAGELVLDSQQPLRYVGISVKGEAVHFAAPEGVTHFVMPLVEIRNRTKGEAFEVRTVDASGNMTHHSARSLGM